MAISKQEEKALFRFNIIFPLLDSSLPNGVRTGMIREIAEKEYKIPYSKKTTICSATVWNWYYTYRKEGTIDSLAPASRTDKGKRRRLSPETQEELLRRHRAAPHIPIKYLVAKAAEEGVFTSEDTMSMSAIYQFFSREKKGADKTQKDTRAYRAPTINTQWQADAAHGPKVFLGNGKKVTAKLFTLLDNKSRLICYAKWYEAETTVCFLDCLWNAFRLRGLPHSIYTDNGSCFRDDRLKLGCASLSVNLIYARIYRPQGKGAIERYHRTVRQQFLSMLPREELSLDELNIRFEKWIDVYNHRVHSSLEGMSPLQCYLSELNAIRPAPDDLPKHFKRSDTRIVAADRTIRFLGKQLEVPIGYSGRKIEIRFFDHDPLHTCEGFFDGESIGMLYLVDKVANFQARRKEVQS